jgi:lysozyme
MENDTKNKAAEGLAAFIKGNGLEGCKLSAYKCPAGIWTIGYGVTRDSNGVKIIEGMKWPQERAESELKLLSYTYVEKALKYSPKLAEMAVGTLVAIADFIYNLGEGNYASSSLKKAIDIADIPTAKLEIVKWNKAGGQVLNGLVKRRKLECDLMK